MLIIIFDNNRQGRIFKVWGSSITTGLDPTDFMISGGNLSNLSQNGSGYDFDFSAFSYAILQSLDAGAASAGHLYRMPFLNLLSSQCFNSPGQFSVVVHFDDLNASMIIETFQDLVW